MTSFLYKYNLFIIALIASCIGVVGAIGTTYLLKTLIPTPHVVMIDVKSIISQKAAHLSSTQKSDKELEGEVQKFVKQLPEQVRTWAQQNRFIVIKPEICLSGVPNMTGALLDWMELTQFKEGPSHS